MLPDSLLYHYSGAAYINFDLCLFQESLPEEVLNTPVRLIMPSLKHVKMLAFTGTEDEHNFVTMLKKQGVSLQKITLFPVKIDGNSCHQYPPVVLRRKPRECVVTESEL